MITELIQVIIVFIKQTFCWHDYKTVIRKDNYMDYQLCKKCGYIKSDGMLWGGLFIFIVLFITVLTMWYATRCNI